MTEIKNIENAIIDSIDASSATSLAGEITEIALDKRLDEGLLKDIPIINVLVAAKSMHGVIKDHIFLKKVARFLFYVAKIEECERKKFIEKIRAKKMETVLGETLILLIDRLDDYDKPKIMAKMFNSYLLNEIDFEDFKRLCLTLDKFSLASIKALKDFYTKEAGMLYTDGEYLSEFASIGLASITFHDNSALGVGGEFDQTKFGRLFVSFF